MFDSFKIVDYHVVIYNSVLVESWSFPSQDKVSKACDFNNPSGRFRTWVGLPFWVEMLKLDNHECGYIGTLPMHTAG